MALIIPTALASAFTSVTVGHTVARLLDIMKNDKKEHRDLLPNLDRLGRNVRRIEELRDTIFLGNPKIISWYMNLKDLMYDAVDLLDGYAIAVDSKVLDTPMDDLRNSVFTFTIHKIDIGGSFSLVHEVKSINEKIEGLYEEGKKHGYKETVQEEVDNQKIGKRETNALVDIDHPLRGMTNIKNEVITKMMKCPPGEEAIDHGPRVIGIVGLGGMGKTTLARFAYNVSKNLGGFELRGWVWISSLFDKKRLFADILKEFGDLHTDLIGAQRLDKVVKGKKYLLVLDDAWSKLEKDWVDLLFPLKGGKKGSRLIVTTRDNNVLAMIKKSTRGMIEPEIELKGLDDNILWEIVKEHAFSECDADVPKNLEEIGKNMVKKARGSPLAAKAIGGLLGQEISERHWKEVQGANLWDSLEHGDYKDDLVAALMLSFLHLRTEIKPCFTYSSLYPKGEVIPANEIIYQWLAHDYLGHRDKNIHFRTGHDDEKSIEDVGADIIKYLESLCLLDRNGRHIIMHDLVHDTSRASGRDDHLLVQLLNIGSLGNLPKERLRHLHIISRIDLGFEPFEKIEKCVKLRTLMLRGYQDPFFQGDHRDLESGLDASSLANCLKQLRRLRVLTLSFLRMSMLPEEIGLLNHLKFLEVSFTTIEKVPNAVGKLYSLQVLILTYSGISSSEEMKFLGQLLNLHYLDLSRNNGLESLPEAITVLSKLRILLISDCCNLKCLPNGIRNLGSLERLDISGCTAITELPGDLGCLSCLRELDLQSCKNLRRLPCEIVKLNKLRRLYSEWNLTFTLSGIGNLTSLETLENFHVGKTKGQTITELRNLNMLQGSLTISGLENVNEDEGKFAELEQKIHVNKVVFEWFNTPGKRMCGWNDERKALIQQEQRVVEGLKPNQHLEKLVITGYEGRHPPSWLQRHHLCFLKTLVLHRCPNIMYLDQKQLKASGNGSWMFPQSLEHTGAYVSEDMQNTMKDKGMEGLDMPLSLEFMGFSFAGLIKLPELLSQNEVRNVESSSSSQAPSPSSFQQVPSLAVVCIVGCPRLTSLSTGFLERRLPYLRRLIITYCKNLMNLPSNGFKDFKALQMLHIGFCPKLLKLSKRSDTSAFPPNLHKLRIENCLGLEVNSLRMSLDLQAVTCLKELTLINSCDNMSDSFLRYVLIPHLKKISNCEIYYHEFHMIISQGRDASFFWDHKKDNINGNTTRLREERCSREELLICILQCFGPLRIQRLLISESRDLILCSSMLGQYFHKLINSKTYLVLSQGRRFSHEEISSYRDKVIFKSVQFSDIYNGSGNFVFKGCENLSSLGEGILNNPLPHIRRLVIKDCINLVLPPVNGFTLLIHLQSLTLRNCPKLTCLSLGDGCAFPPYMKELVIINCKSLEADSLHVSLLSGSNSLRKLVLKNCCYHLSNSFLKGVMAGILKNLDYCSIEASDQCFEFYWSKSEGNVGIMWDGRYIEEVGKVQLIRNGEVAVDSCTREDILEEILGRISCSLVQALVLVGIHEISEVVNGRSGQLFLNLSSLSFLQVVHCENLRSLPINMRSLCRLRTLEVISCHNFSPPDENWAQVEVGKSFLGLTSIECLRLQKCDKLRSLPCSFVLKYLEIRHCNGILDLSNLNHPMPWLQSLVICDCANLEHPPEKGFVSLTSLETLILKNCPKLSQLSMKEEYLDFPSTLSRLRMKGCKSLHIGHIERNLSSLSSLQRLVIADCGGYVTNSFVKKVLNCFSPHKFIWDCTLFSTRLLVKSVEEIYCHEKMSALAIEWKDVHQEEVNGDSCNCYKFLVDILNFMSTYNVTHITISGLHELTTLEGELKEAIVNLTSLRVLIFSNCRNLCCLPTIEIASMLPSFRILQKKSCDMLPTLDSDQVTCIIKQE